MSLWYNAREAQVEGLDLSVDGNGERDGRGGEVICSSVKTRFTQPCGYETARMKAEKAGASM